MAKPGVAYPQVEPSAAALMDRRVVTCPAGRHVAAALEAARRAGAEVLLVGNRRAVRRRDLERVCRWGLTGLRAAEVGWDGLPVVPATAPELRARRLLMDGAPMILVRDGRRVVGVIDAEAVEVARPALSLMHRLDRLGDSLAWDGGAPAPRRPAARVSGSLASDGGAPAPRRPAARTATGSRSGEARLWLLRVAGKVGEGLGTPVFAVGGFVRDLLLESPAPDVDLVVEGDGLAFARQLCEELGGSLVIHKDFATAAVEGAAGPGGTALGRIDIASARREQYDAPGALPVVSVATVEEDLRRRDFSVNALALALQPSTFGRLVDPLGGWLDLRRRRLRPLHPLSFVEDPTRIFRAARYASRLRFRLDAGGVRALRLALRVGDYPALSGQRLRAELDLLASEPRGWRGLELLLKWGGLKLWEQGYLVSSRGPNRVRAAERLCSWARRVGIGLDPSEVALIALLADQRAPIVTRCLARLALSGEPFSRLYAAATAAPLARRLDGGRWRRPSEVALALQSCAIQVLVGAWLHGGARARRRIQWFLSRGRRVRPLLSGDDVVALGVPRGPDVGECLAALRRLRLDGVVRTRSQERAFVKAWRPERGRRARATGGSGAGSNRKGGLT